MVRKFNQTRKYGMEWYWIFIRQIGTEWNGIRMTKPWYVPTLIANNIHSNEKMRMAGANGYVILLITYLHLRRVPFHQKWLMVSMEGLKRVSDLQKNSLTHNSQLLLWGIKQNIYLLLLTSESVTPHKILDNGQQPNLEVHHSDRSDVQFGTQVIMHRLFVRGFLCF
jgi:hypothetical protein